MIYTKEQIKEKMTLKMREVIEALEAFSAPALETVNPQVARELPTMSDAALGVISKHLIKKINGPVISVGRVDHQVIGTQEDEILLRIYSPEGEGPFPILLYFHGGGWVIANMDSYDTSCRALCSEARAVVVSVGYRQGPEFKYPQAHTDAIQAYRWVLAHVTRLKGLRSDIHVIGESAGGNLAASVSLQAREMGLPPPAHQVLIYPVTDINSERGSHEIFKNALPLNQAMMPWFKKHYLRSEADSISDLVSPLNADLRGLPPTTIINAEIDPLCTDGEEFAQKLADAGVDIVQKTYSGVTHEFFGLMALLPEAKEALELVVERIKSFSDDVEDRIVIHGMKDLAPEQSAFRDTL